MKTMTYDEIVRQLPEGARILRQYTGFEDGNHRVIVKLPGRDHETRYIVCEDKDAGTESLIEKP
jgi:hypothetical protein